jgi:hypothetical protein
MPVAALMLHTELYIQDIPAIFTCEVVHILVMLLCQCVDCLLIANSNCDAMSYNEVDLLLYA